MQSTHKREAWNKGKLVGQKPPLKPKDIWAIRIYLQNDHAVRDLAMFNLAIDSKLGGCELVSSVDHNSSCISFHYRMSKAYSDHGLLEQGVL